MNARDLALAQLDQKNLPGWKAGLLSAGPGTADDPRDLALAEQITVGVIKNLLLLQDRIGHHSGRRLNQIDPLVQKILAIGMDQLLFLDRVPASAAVDEAVKQTRRFGRPRAAGFVNAVLRNVQRQPPPPEPDLASEPSKYAERVLSHPPELFEKLARIVGPARALDICRHDNQEPPLLVRLFEGVDDRALADPCVEVLPHEMGNIRMIRDAGRSTLAHWAESGLAQVQDATAAGVADLLDISAGQRVLDRCAGLGTKTMQLREQAGEEGHVLAVDPSAERCQTLSRLLDRRQIRNVQVLPVAFLAGLPQASEPFHRILVDVPCSNSGVLARRAEARYYQQPARLRSLSRLQRDILIDTAPLLSRGGILVYSTCSIFPEENQEQAQWLLRQFPNLHLEEELITLPSLAGADGAQYHDGGYAARFGLK